MSALYPVLLDLAARRCVIVGGGRVAERKLRGLRESGALVTVIAPRVTQEIERAVSAGDVTLRRRPYRGSDVECAFMVFVATDDSVLNAAAVRDARAAGALVNAAEEPSTGDFVLPATLRRQDLVVAISTGGRSPSFARQLRDELESWLTPDRLELLELLAEVREELLAEGGNPPPEVWRRAGGSDVLDALATGDRRRARALLLGELGLAPAGA